MRLPKPPKHVQEAASLLGIEPQEFTPLFLKETASARIFGCWVKQAQAWKLCRIAGRGNGECFTINLQVGMAGLCDLLSTPGALAASFDRREAERYGLLDASAA